jgi:hypothetical protein
MAGFAVLEDVGCHILRAEAVGLESPSLVGIDCCFQTTPWADYENFFIVNLAVPEFFRYNDAVDPTDGHDL